MNQPRLLCPYLDRRDVRCAESFTLTNIQEAFRLCVGDYESCAVYHQIRRAEHRSETRLPVEQSA